MRKSEVRIQKPGPETRAPRPETRFPKPGARTPILLALLLLVACAAPILAAAAADRPRPSRPPMIFEPTPGPAPEFPSTQPTTRPSRVSVRIPEAPLPPMPVRKTPVTFSEQRPPLTKVRQPIDTPTLYAASDPLRPGQPLMTAGPRYTAPTVYEPWLPLAYLAKLRQESPVRAHEPVLDPMGGSGMSALPAFRSTPVPAQRNPLPNPFENMEAVKLLDPPADADAPASPAQRPPLPPLPLEKVTAPVAPATQPAK